VWKSSRTSREDRLKMRGDLACEHSAGVDRASAVSG
jgi:hypothetical protein